MELHDLVAPPPPADFRERLWERAEEWQRRRARTWRIAALAATAVAVAAIGSAGVFALDRGVVAPSPPTFDQTVGCQVPVRGGIPVIDLSTEPTGWYYADGARKPRIADLLLGTSSFGSNQSANYLMFTSGPHTFGPLKDAPCSKHSTISLARAGLPLYDTVKAPSDGVANAVNLSCFTGTTIVVRQHLRIARGSVAAAQVAVRSGKKLRPLLYVDWTPTKVTVYATDDCHT
jgi:hypothetical protein